MGEETLTLKGRRVKSFEDVERVRVIRNQVRRYMTRDTATIDPAAQMRWWKSLNHETNRLFVFDVEGAEEGVSWRSLAGYGLSRFLGDRWWLSGALSNEWQGKGLGKDLFSFLVKDADGPCWLEVQEDNMRALNTYVRIGFGESSRADGVITMVKS